MIEALLDPKRIKLDMQATTKREALEELVDLLELDEHSKKILLDALWKRELAASTGVGRGIAIPHTRSTVLKGLHLVVGISKKGIDFDSADGKPVHIIFMLVSDYEDTSSQYLIALGNIAQLARKLVDTNADYLSVSSEKELIDLLVGVWQKEES